MVLGANRRTARTARPSSASCQPAALPGAEGASLVEVTIVLAIIFCVLTVGVPLLANGADARRTNDAASFLAGQFRLARQRAVLTGRHHGVVFEDDRGEVRWRLCEDGDRDGLSRSDVVSGVDRCEAVEQPLSYRFSEVTVAYAPGVPTPDGELNSPGLRFGLAQMAVFTPTGTATAGTIAVSGPGEHQFAVRVSSVTGRTRVLRFDRGSREWIE